MNLPSDFTMKVKYPEDPFEREVYETFAITTLCGRYNKAKTYRQRSASPLIAEEIDDMLYEIDALRVERATLKEDLRQIAAILHPPKPRRFNNFTGEISDAHSEYVAFFQRRMDTDELSEEEAEYRRCRERLREIDDE